MNSLKIDTVACLYVYRLVLRIVNNEQNMRVKASYT